MGLRCSDVVLAAVVGVVQVVGTSAAAAHQSEARPIDALGVCLLLLGPLALLGLRQMPEVPLAVSLGALIGYLSLDYPVGPVFVAFAVALVNAVLVRRRSIAVGSAVVLYASVLIALAADEIDAGNAVGAGAWLLAFLAVSEVVRIRRDAAATARRAFETEHLRRAGEQRLLIARELHDVLAHSISVISVQAGVGLHLLEDRPEAAREALLAIKAASGDGLRDLRRTLDLLREDAALVPTPGLADLARLIDRSRAAGLTVTHTATGAPRSVDAATGLATYRVVQEALTNVARHAGGKCARVCVGYGDAELDVRIDDDGPAANPDGAGGHGLAGMAERVRTLGGTLSTGTRPDGGFSVHARMPL